MILTETLLSNPGESFAFVHTSDDRGVYYRFVHEKSCWEVVPVIGADIVTVSSWAPVQQYLDGVADHIVSDEEAEAKKELEVSIGSNP